MDSTDSSSGQATPSAQWLRAAHVVLDHIIDSGALDRSDVLSVDLYSVTQTVRLQLAGHVDAAEFARALDLGAVQNPSPAHPQMVRWSGDVQGITVVVTSFRRAAEAVAS